MTKSDFRYRFWVILPWAILALLLLTNLYFSAMKNAKLAAQEVLITAQKRVIEQQQTVLDDRYGWMDDLRIHSAAVGRDRVQHSAVQEAINIVCDALEIDRVEVSKYEPKSKFPIPPKPPT